MPWFWFLNVGNFGARLSPGCSSYGVRVPCLCVQMLSLYATGWLVFPKCMQLTLVRWYVVSMLCCHCWMFSLSNADAKLSLLKYGYFVSATVRHNLLVLVSYWSLLLHKIGGILWLTLWRCWLHSCRMFILLVEYGLMHRDDCINCETCYFCFDPAFVWPSLGRADFHSA